MRQFIFRIFMFLIKTLQIAMLPDGLIIDKHSHSEFGMSVTHYDLPGVYSGY